MVDKKRILVPQDSGVRLFIDLNETLIRTGEVAPDDQIAEIKELSKFVKLCKSLSNKLSLLEVVFLTGNSFEYSRRIEEPLGLKNADRISVIIVSENGLIGRSFKEGDLWRADVNQKYFSLTRELLSRLERDESISKCFYTQGNEIRLTLKPVLNEFRSVDVHSFKRIMQEMKIRDHCEIYVHPYYIDIDPKVIYVNGRKQQFEGKRYAVYRLANRMPMLNLGIGDSLSDIPMFEAIRNIGGEVFWVSNARDSESFQDATLLKSAYTQGVNDMLESIQIS